MTRQFKKEILNDVTGYIDRHTMPAEPPEAVANMILYLLSNIGALSEEAYQQEPLTGFVCSKCFFAVKDKTMISKHYKPFTVTDCDGKFVPVKEVKE